MFSINLFRKLGAGLGTLGFLLLATSTCWAQGPAIAIHPLFTESDAIFEPGLQGTWHFDGGTLTFEENGGNSYNLTLQKENVKLEFRGRVGRLNGVLILDVTVKALPSPVNDWDYFEVTAHLCPVHTFHRLTLNGQSLRIEFFEMDWLVARLREKKVKIRHEVMEDYTDAVLLTAATKDLRKLISKYAHDPKAFELYAGCTRTPANEGDGGDQRMPLAPTLPRLISR